MLACSSPCTLHSCYLISLHSDEGGSFDESVKITDLIKGSKNQNAYTRFLLNDLAYGK